MRQYKKTVTRSFVGTITVSIEDDLGRCCGVEFFDGYPFESEESKFKRAHKWADNLIQTLMKYEENAL